MDAELFQKAWALALRRLARREYSAQELSTYLEGRGVESEVAERVISQLKQEKLLDEKRYTESVVRYYLARGKGPEHVLGQLRRRGIELGRAALQALMEEQSLPTEKESALALLKRRYPEALEDPQVRERAYRGLIQRGFRSSLVQSLLRARSWDHEED